MEVSHELVGTKPLSESRCHDDTSDRKNRVVQIIHKHIITSPQCIEKRSGLAAKDCDDAFPIEKPEDRIAEFRPGAFEITKFVDHGPLGRRIDGAGDGGSAWAKKSA